MIEPRGRPSRRGLLELRLVLAVAVLAISVWVAHRGEPNVVEVNAFRLINELPTPFGPPLLGVMQLGALAAVPGLAAIAVVRHRRNLGRDLLAGGAIAWTVAKVLQTVVDQESPEVLLGHAVLHGSGRPGLAFPATHVAVAAALATVAAPHLSRPNRRLAWFGVVAIGVARMYVGAHFPIDVIGGVAVGWIVGSLFRLAVRSPAVLPDADSVRAAIGDAGGLGRLCVDGVLGPVASPHSGIARYRTDGGSPTLITVVGRDQPEADWLYRAWRIIAFREPEDRAPPHGPHQRVEHEAYVLLLAERAGVRVPRLVATRDLGDDVALLARGWVDGTPLGDGPLGDAVIVDAWAQLTALHDADIDCGGVMLDDFVVAADGHVWLTDLGNGSTDGSDDRFSRDDADFCVAVAGRYGVDVATRTSVVAMDADRLCRLVNHLQPLLLSPQNRRMAARDQLLVRLRATVAEAAGIEPPPLVSPTRVAVKNLLPLFGALFAVNLLLPQVGQGRATLDAMAKADWEWVPAIALASAATYIAAAIALMGAARIGLALGRTWAVQIAAAFTNRLAPAGIGGMTTNVRYLESAGKSRTDAVATVGLNSLAGLLVHLVGVLAIVPLLGAGHTHLRFSGPDFPERWSLLLLVIGAFVVVGLLRWGAVVRSRVTRPLRDVWRTLTSAARNPRAGLVLLVGAAGITASYTAALFFATRAFRLHLPIATVAAVFLGGSVVSAAAPTPGGLGAVEAAFVAGLTVAGAPNGPAIASVLTYRLVTYWLPIIPGWFSYRVLRRAGTI
ncbi:MAG: hypothetical protein JWO37_1030 [Acidimicrobiales bacterium]|jgi:uncharacterized membrane protein YbhN (UPF0104 family)/membrane-associated phospholipid phosphatase|nr:hypothetical protein [Acidimicrobiales bacterium]